MSLHQIKHIGSVGRFRAASASGDVAFKKFTLIFGENGRGKTTLCSILRSLQNNDPAIIIGRKTLGDSRDPNIVLAFQNGPIQFKGGRWNAEHTKLRIFDAQYVAENVYFGDGIGTDQRRNLCRVMLGRDGVLLAEAYDKADTAITIKTHEIRDVRKHLTAHVQQHQIDNLIALEEDPDIEAKIEVKAREVEGLKEIDNLRTRQLLQALEFPKLPTRLEEILGKTLQGVSRDAEATVRKHVAAHDKEGHEDWLATGMAYVQDDECPFCGQNTEGVDLIAAYAAYFNDAYIAFKGELETYTRLPEKHYSDDRIEVLLSRIETNASNADVWKRYVTLKAPVLKGEVAKVIKAFRDEMIALLNKKNANALEAVRLSTGYRDAYQTLSTLSASVQAYNEAVTAANAAIEKFKSSASAAKLQSAQNALKWLELTKKRHEAPLSDFCDEYVKLIEEKEVLDAIKADARAKLDAYSGSVVDTYRKSINAYLKTFTAGFHLDQMKVEYSGRVPNSTYCVVINETPVDLGKNDTPLSEPSFRNTLSSGDKSTLALAFFLAQVKADPERGECIVVLDDPFSSQDQFRRTCTMGEIVRCGRDVAQVIVMSHDGRFLRELWERDLPSDDRKALWLIQAGKKDTVIAEWPIETDTESEDAGNRRVLLSYYHESKGNPRDVVKKLRPVVETHMKRMAPELAGIKGLGKMLNKIRENDGPPYLMSAYDEIDDINTYTRKYMHGEGKNPDTEPVHTTELHGFVGKVLEIAGALVE
ncbi:MULTISPECIES: AAA family ATPase [Bradyrhizobium]|uniref:AAA family ATPase n=1 Tax=Bradyrhizobium TaxID=374 RepID=UPI000D73527F|nr:AAA family ATPase [Bradyrhizobium diazoefficiens]AWO87807.1 AAA family ATPase [Bradyrhizobium diazoefficiens]